MQGMATLEVIAPLSEITSWWEVEDREDRKHHLQHCSTVGNLQEGLIGEVIFEQNFYGRPGLFQAGQGIGTFQVGEPWAISDKQAKAPKAWCGNWE